MAEHHSRVKLARGFSELQAAARAREWEAAARLAIQYDRLLPTMLATREPDTLAYFETSTNGSLV